MNDLRSNQESRRLPVVALMSESDDPEDGAGASICLQHPFTMHHLLDALARVVHVDLQDPILIVDNDPQVRRMIGDMLIDAGYPVQGVASGEIALTWLQKRRASLIILDVVMPGMNGFEVLRELRRRHDEAAELPVVIATGQQLSGADMHLLQELNATMISKDALGGNALLHQVQWALNQYTRRNLML